MRTKEILIIASIAICTFEGLAQKAKPSLVGKEFTTASGLKYEILSEGKGARAKSGDVVKLHYTGKLPNDTVFDSSIPRGKPFSFKLGVGQVIKGWDEGVALLNVGDKAKFIIPPELGYGSRDMGSIPPNSTLIFEVELLGIQEAAKPYDVSKKDTVKLASGLQYIVVKKNEKGASPQKGKGVGVHYSGYLENGKMFDSSVERGAIFTFPLGQGRVIKGWDEGVALMKVGEKVRFIIPPDLAYGSRGYPPVIPPNSTLIFDVELFKVDN